MALFHDIGHPPFGHAGEDVLAECLREEGGFSHNRYALTLAEELESRYEHYPGLNLTYEVLECQLDRVDKEDEGRWPLLEAQLVDMADSATYDAHDTDDAVKLSYVTLEEMAEIPLVGNVLGRVRRRWTNLNPDLLRKAVVHELVDLQVSDILEHSGLALIRSDLESAEEARYSGIRIQPSQELAEQKAELEAFLYERVYRHPKIIDVRENAQNCLREMFYGYQERPELLPARYLERAETVGLPRTVGDYLAGMTDQFCYGQYKTLFATS